MTPCPLCNDDGVLHNYQGDKLGPCYECARWCLWCGKETTGTCRVGNEDVVTCAECHLKAIETNRRATVTPESPTLPPEATTGQEGATDTPPGVWGLRKALNASGMTREDFARKVLGVTPSAVWRWLNGRPIPQTVQDRLSHYLTTGV